MWPHHRFQPSLQRISICAPHSCQMGLLSILYNPFYFILAHPFSAYWSCINYSFPVGLTATTLQEAYLDCLTIQGALSSLVYFISIFEHFLTESYSHVYNLQHTAWLSAIPEKIKQNNMLCKNTFGHKIIFISKYIHSCNSRKQWNKAHRRGIGLHS